MNQQTEQLAGTVAQIRCEEQPNTQWTEQIAGEVTVALQELYGDLTNSLVEHLVRETLFRVAGHIRQGHPVNLESLGMLLPAVVAGKRVVLFEPCDALTEPLGDRPMIVINLADRRQGGARG